MSHKDAPPETPSQVACREFWQREQPHINRAWGQAKDGSYFAEHSRLLHKSWVTAAAERDAEIEALRAEAIEWRGLFGMAKARADKAEARAERLAEALQWYAEQAEGCRKIGSIGEPFRKELDRDGGRRAREALRDHDQEGKE